MWVQWTVNFRASEGEVANYFKTNKRIGVSPLYTRWLEYIISSEQFMMHTAVEDQGWSLLANSCQYKWAIKPRLVITFSKLKVVIITLKLLKWLLDYLLVM